MYTALIVDDESKLREVMQIKLEQYCPTVKVLGQAANADEAMDKIQEMKPQIVFLDIAMPGESGFQLLERFESIDFEIVFVTGFNEYALDALKVSAVDYVLKPVKTSCLVEAVKRAQKRIDERDKLAKYDVLKYNLNHLGDQESKVAIPGSDAYEFVKVNNIIRCEGWMKYTKIYLSDGNVVLSSYNLGNFRDMLDSYNFYSTHKSHLINTKHISRYVKDGTVVMSSGDVVPVARRRKDDFVEQVIRYLSL